MVVLSRLLFVCSLPVLTICFTSVLLFLSAEVALSVSYILELAVGLRITGRLSLVNLRSVLVEHDLLLEPSLIFVSLIKCLRLWTKIIEINKCLS